MFSIRRLKSGFMRDDQGSASTEWMVAVSIVVMMAVPVLGLVGDGAGDSSEDVVVSIQDTDSMGGDGFHGEEGATEGALFVTGDYVPGADMGIGFAEGEDETTFNVSSATDAPHSFSGLSGMPRRDKPTGPSFTTSSTESLVDVPQRSNGSRPYSVPTAPVLVSQRLRVSDDNCVEDIVADMGEHRDPEIAPVKVVLASGR